MYIFTTKDKTKEKLWLTYCLLFLATLCDAQFSDVFHELARASSNLARKWAIASDSVLFNT